MRAAVLRQPGLPLRIEDVELDAPRAGELAVRVEAAGVCHSDDHYMLGDITCRLPATTGGLMPSSRRAVSADRWWCRDDP
jgi:Zn-dependent alcohol dehydrogenase